ncbi:hypothetical protein [Cribrihabitans pelagius]|uniref:hypothetical protein n=1 Tax=Cribrihabitans pelagius TaxID=1765746 RepID=UPI003B5BC5A1
MEVRAQAPRSSQAAAESKDLIASAAGNIGNGVSEVNNTGAALAQIISRMSGISGRASRAGLSRSRGSQELEGLSQPLGRLGGTARGNSSAVKTPYPPLLACASRQSGSALRLRPSACRRTCGKRPGTPWPRLPDGLGGPRRGRDWSAQRCARHRPAVSGPGAGTTKKGRSAAPS